MAELDTDSLIDARAKFETKAQRDAERALQRKNISLRRQRLVQQQGFVNPRNRSQARQLQSGIDGLDSDLRNLAHEDNRDQSMLDSELKSQHQATQSKINLSNQSRLSQTIDEVGNIAAGQMRLANQYGVGTPEYLNGMLALREQNKLGWATQAAKGHLGPTASLHDKLADENQKTLQKTLFNAHQLSPAQYAARDTTKDRLTNAPVLVDKNGNEDLKTGTPPSHDVVEAKRDANGGTAAVDIDGKTYLFSKPLYDNLNATFGAKKPTDTSAVAPAIPVTPDPNAGIQPMVPTYGGQGAAPPGGLVRNPDGSISPIIPTYGGQGAAPPGALVRTDTGSGQVGNRPMTDEERAVASGYRDLNQYKQFLETGKVVAPEGTIGESAVQAREAATKALVNSGRVVGSVQPDNRTATLPSDVQPNQPLQPVTQLGTQPMVNTPQVAQQPTATPQPIAAQPAGNPTHLGRYNPKTGEFE